MIKIISQKERTGSIMYKLILTSIVLYLLSGLSYATQEANDLQESQVKQRLTCLICRILNLVYALCGVILLPPFVVFMIIAIILVIIYHTSAKESKRKHRSKIGLICSIILLTLMLLLSMFLIILPHLLSFTADVNLPNIIDVLGGCEGVCGLR